MIVKINRQDCIKKYPTLPLRKYNLKEDEYDFYYPQTFAGYVLTLPSKSFKGHVKLLGEEISNLTRDLGSDNLVFLGDLPLPWLYHDNTFKQAKEGLQYLAGNKIGKKFNGGLQVDADQLSTFIKHLGWLIRTAAVLPYVYFIDPGHNIIGTICHYGNLHIDSFSKKADRLVKEFIDNSKFEYVTSGNCYERFSKNGRIKGRQIII